jgi:CRP-like cAMP-binding protein
VEHFAVPLTESVDVKVGERILGRFAAGAIVGAGAFFDPHRMQFEAVASAPCRVLRVPIDAIRRHAERDDQLARTLERIARDDLARKLEQVIGLAATLSKESASASR